jgi:heme-degrading monooxygenase HmoA
MFVALWEYEVKPGDEERFEKAYGPEGDWVRLFRSDANYRETRLLRDPFRAGIYLTLDFWESREVYEKFLSARRAEYEAIDKASASLTINERRIGWFELAAE